LRDALSEEAGIESQEGLRPKCGVLGAFLLKDGETQRLRFTDQPRYLVKPALGIPFGVCPGADQRGVGLAS
jgi:hypothetical protein